MPALRDLFRRALATLLAAALIPWQQPLLLIASAEEPPDPPRSEKKEDPPKPPDLSEGLKKHSSTLHDWLKGKAELNGEKTAALLEELKKLREACSGPDAPAELCAKLETVEALAEARSRAAALQEYAAGKGWTTQELQKRSAELEKLLEAEAARKVPDELAELHAGMLERLRADHLAAKEGLGSLESARIADDLMGTVRSQLPEPAREQMEERLQGVQGRLTAALAPQKSGAAPSLDGVMNELGRIYNEAGVGADKLQETFGLLHKTAGKHGQRAHAATAFTPPELVPKMPGKGPVGAEVPAVAAPEWAKGSEGRLKTAGKDAWEQFAALAPKGTDPKELARVWAGMGFLPPVVPGVDAKSLAGRIEALTDAFMKAGAEHRSAALQARVDRLLSDIPLAGKADPARIAEWKAELASLGKRLEGETGPLSQFVRALDANGKVDLTALNPAMQAEFVSKDADGKLRLGQVGEALRDSHARGVEETRAVQAKVDSLAKLVQGASDADLPAVLDRFFQENPGLKDSELGQVFQSWRSMAGSAAGGEPENKAALAEAEAKMRENLRQYVTRLQETMGTEGSADYKSLRLIRGGFRDLNDSLARHLAERGSQDRAVQDFLKAHEALRNDKASGIDREMEVARLAKLALNTLPERQKWLAMADSEGAFNAALARLDPANDQETRERIGEIQKQLAAAKEELDGISGDSRLKPLHPEAARTYFMTIDDAKRASSGMGAGEEAVWGWKMIPADAKTLQRLAGVHGDGLQKLDWLQGLGVSLSAKGVGWVLDPSSGKRRIPVDPSGNMLTVFSPDGLFVRMDASYLKTMREKDPSLFTELTRDMPRTAVGMATGDPVIIEQGKQDLLAGTLQRQIYVPVGEGRDRTFLVLGSRDLDALSRQPELARQLRDPGALLRRGFDRGRGSDSGSDRLVRSINDALRAFDPRGMRDAPRDLPLLIANGGKPIPAETETRLQRILPGLIRLQEAGAERRTPAETAGPKGLPRVILSPSVLDDVELTQRFDQHLAMPRERPSPVFADPKALSQALTLRQRPALALSPFGGLDPRARFGFQDDLLGVGSGPETFFRDILVMPRSYGPRLDAVPGSSLVEHKPGMTDVGPKRAAVEARIKGLEGEEAKAEAELAERQTARTFVEAQLGMPLERFLRQADKAEVMRLVMAAYQNGLGSPEKKAEWEALRAKAVEYYHGVEADRQVPNEVQDLAALAKTLAEKGGSEEWLKAAAARLDSFENPTLLTQGFGDKLSRILEKQAQGGLRSLTTGEREWLPVWEAYKKHIPAGALPEGGQPLSGAEILAALRKAGYPVYDRTLLEAGLQQDPQALAEALSEAASKQKDLRLDQLVFNAVDEDKARLAKVFTERALAEMDGSKNRPLRELSSSYQSREKAFSDWLLFTQDPANAKTMRSFALAQGAEGELLRRQGQVLASYGDLPLEAKVYFWDRRADHNSTFYAHHDGDTGAKKVNVATGTSYEAGRAKGLLMEDFDAQSRQFSARMGDRQIVQQTMAATFTDHDGTAYTVLRSPLGTEGRPETVFQDKDKRLFVMDPEGKLKPWSGKAGALQSVYEFTEFAQSGADKPQITVSGRYARDRQKALTSLDRGAMELLSQTYRRGDRAFEIVDHEAGFEQKVDGSEAVMLFLQKDERGRWTRDAASRMEAGGYHGGRFFADHKYYLQKGKSGSSELVHETNLGDMVWSVRTMKTLDGGAFSEQRAKSFAASGGRLDLLPAYHERGAESYTIDARLLPAGGDERAGMIGRAAVRLNDVVLRRGKDGVEQTAQFLRTHLDKDVDPFGRGQGIDKARHSVSIMVTPGDSRDPSPTLLATYFREGVDETTGKKTSHYSFRYVGKFFKEKETPILSSPAETADKRDKPVTFYEYEMKFAQKIAKALNANLGKSEGLLIARQIGAGDMEVEGVMAGLGKDGREVYLKVEKGKSYVNAGIHWWPELNSYNYFERSIRVGGAKVALPYRIQYEGDVISLVGHNVEDWAAANPKLARGIAWVVAPLPMALMNPTDEQLAAVYGGAAKGFVRFAPDLLMVVIPVGAGIAVVKWGLTAANMARTAKVFATTAQVFFMASMVPGLAQSAGNVIQAARSGKPDDIRQATDDMVYWSLMLYGAPKVMKMAEGRLEAPGKTPLPEAPKPGIVGRFIEGMNRMAERSGERVADSKWGGITTKADNGVIWATSRLVGKPLEAVGLNRMAAVYQGKAESPPLLLRNTEEVQAALREGGVNQAAPGKVLPKMETARLYAKVDPVTGERGRLSAKPMEAGKDGTVLMLDVLVEAGTGRFDVRGAQFTGRQPSSLANALVFDGLVGRSGAAGVNVFDVLSQVSRAEGKTSVDILYDMRTGEPVRVLKKGEKPLSRPGEEFGVASMDVSVKGGKPSFGELRLPEGVKLEGPAGRFLQAYSQALGQDMGTLSDPAAAAKLGFTGDAWSLAEYQAQWRTAERGQGPKKSSGAQPDIVEGQACHISGLVAELNGSAFAAQRQALLQHPEVGKKPGAKLTTYDLLKVLESELGPETGPAMTGAILQRGIFAEELGFINGKLSDAVAKRGGAPLSVETVDAGRALSSPKAFREAAGQGGLLVGIESPNGPHIVRALEVVKGKSGLEVVFEDPTLRNSVHGTRMAMPVETFLRLTRLDNAMKLSLSKPAPALEELPGKAELPRQGFGAELSRPELWKEVRGTEVSGRGFSIPEAAALRLAEEAGPAFDKAGGKSLDLWFDADGSLLHVGKKPLLGKGTQVRVDGVRYADALMLREPAPETLSKFSPEAQARILKGLKAFQDNSLIVNQFERAAERYGLKQADLVEMLELARIMRAAELPNAPVVDRIFYDSVGRSIPEQGIKMRIGDFLAPEGAGRAEVSAGRKAVLEAFLQAAKDPALAKMFDFKVTLAMDAMGGTQAGKFITIYSKDPQSAMALMKELNKFMAERGLKTKLPPEDFRAGEVAWRFGRFSQGDLAAPDSRGAMRYQADDRADAAANLLFARNIPGMQSWVELARQGPKWTAAHEAELQAGGAQTQGRALKANTPEFIPYDGPVQLKLGKEGGRTLEILDRADLAARYPEMAARLAGDVQFLIIDPANPAQFKGVRNGEVVELGRQTQAGARFDLPQTVGRRHMRVTGKEGGLIYEDLGSSGTEYGGGGKRGFGASIPFESVVAELAGKKGTDPKVLAEAFRKYNAAQEVDLSLFDNAAQLKRYLSGVLDKPEFQAGYLKGQGSPAAGFIAELDRLGAAAREAGRRVTRAELVNAYEAFLQRNGLQDSIELRRQVQGAVTSTLRSRDDSGPAKAQPSGHSAGEVSLEEASKIASGEFWAPVTLKGDFVNWKGLEFTIDKPPHQTQDLYNGKVRGRNEVLLHRKPDGTYEIHEFEPSAARDPARQAALRKAVDALFNDRTGRPGHDPFMRHPSVNRDAFLESLGSLVEPKLRRGFGADLEGAAGRWYKEEGGPKPEPLPVGLELRGRLKTSEPIHDNVHAGRVRGAEVVIKENAVPNEAPVLAAMNGVPLAPNVRIPKLLASEPWTTGTLAKLGDQSAITPAKARELASEGRHVLVMEKLPDDFVSLKDVLEGKAKLQGGIAPEDWQGLLTSLQSLHSRRLGFGDLNNTTNIRLRQVAEPKTGRLTTEFALIDTGQGTHQGRADVLQGDFNQVKGARGIETQLLESGLLKGRGELAQPRVFAPEEAPKPISPSFLGKALSLFGVQGPEIRFLGSGGAGKTFSFQKPGEDPIAVKISWHRGGPRWEAFLAEPEMMDSVHRAYSKAPAPNFDVMKPVQRDFTYLERDALRNAALKAGVDPAVAAETVQNGVIITAGLVKGRTLLQFLEGGGTLTPADRGAIQAGLRRLNEAGYLATDISRKNLMVSEDPARGRVFTLIDTGGMEYRTPGTEGYKKALAKQGAYLESALGSPASEVSGRGFGADARKPVYEASPKHGAGTRMTSKGVVQAAPANGQGVLDSSVQVKETSTRRVGFDRETGEFVVFDETLNGVFHGHVRPWEDLTSDMQNALIRAGTVNRKGKPKESP